MTRPPLSLEAPGSKQSVLSGTPASDSHERISEQRMLRPDLFVRAAGRFSWACRPPRDLQT